MISTPPLSSSWLVRPIVWFAAASIVTTILHEVAHVTAAYVLGVRSTLYNYSGNLDLTPEQAASNLPAAIRVAGPLFCLLFGVCSWLMFKQARGRPAELPLLYFSVFGVATFFGNLMSTPFVGDFSGIAIALHVPMPLRYACAVVGLVTVAAIHVWAGRQLVHWAPVHVGKVAGVIGIAWMPAVLGTAVVVLINQPMPAASMSARVGEASFWLFAVIGAMTMKRDPANDRSNFGLRWLDGVVIAAAILAVRLMVRGIPFVP